MANYLTNDTDLSAVANAIRAKGGTSSPLEYPDEFVSAIEAIDIGPDIPIFTVSYNGDGYITGVTCDKTYSECIALLDESNETVQAFCENFGASGYLYYSSGERLLIFNVADYNFERIIWVIKYYPNGTLTIEERQNMDVGSGLTFSGSIATLSSGYYPDTGYKYLPSAAQATPTIAFSSNGLITATAVQTSGYVSAGTKTSTYSLTTRSYIDMYQSGLSVYAPSGYYSSDARFLVPAANHTDPTLAFISSTGYVRAAHDATDAIYKMLQGAYTTYSSMTLPVFAATTWTPSSTNQTISSYQWLTGSQTILGDADLVPSNIKSGVNIFGINGIVEDLNDVPTIYCSNYGDTYSCNMTYNQIRSLIENQLGPILGIYVNEDASLKRGGSWNIEDDNTITLDYENRSVLYHSDGTFEPLGRTDIPVITPTSSTQYIYPEDPYWYFGGVRVNGDTNLVASNIKSGVSIFGVQGTLSGDRSFENNIVQRKYISSYINNDISMIGSYAFAYQNIGYMECLSVKSIYSYAFQYAGNSTFSNGMSFPSCTSLGAYAFYCAYMSKVSFPNCVTIPGSCFYSCSSLVEVSFPNCTRISQSAFYNAKSLISADFSQVTSIQQYAFYGCSKLISISFPKCTYVGDYTFAYCSSLENIYLPMLDNSVYSGCMNVFAGCTNLSSINLPVMTQIGKYMFNSCVKLRNVSIPLCESIFDSAFKNCTSLSSISFSLCAGIWSNAFESCTNLIDVNLPALVSLQGSVFKNCTALESINLPLLQSLVTDTFFNCNNLKNVSFPVCSYFGTRVFAGCSSLAFNNIYAPNVTKIGASVFADCIGFSEVFYSSIVFDGAYAFTGCQNLTSVTLVDCPGIWTYTFASCYNLLSLYLLGSSVTALSNRSAFNSTPIFGYTTSTGGISGSIFVPASLYSSYISATNWTLLSSRFVSLTDTEIAALTS